MSQPIDPSIESESAAAPAGTAAAAGFQQEVGEMPAHPGPGAPTSPETPAYNYQAPFDHADAQMPKQAGSGKAVIWALSGALGAILIAGVGFLVFQSLQDPYRTLDTFPASRYMEDYQGVVGSRFRAEVVVDAELGGSFEKGRLLSFRDAASQKAIVVLVPPSLSQTSFSKGQSYVTELEVGQGGLIHAHGFKKK